MKHAVTAADGCRAVIDGPHRPDANAATSNDGAAEASARPVSAAVGPARTDAGTASLLAVALVGLLLVLGMAANLVVAAAAAHRTAQAAADLAALAGAQAWQVQANPATACGAARSVAEENGAGLTDCRLAGDDLLAIVRVDGPRMFGHEFEIVGRARAGPKEAG